MDTNTGISPMSQHQNFHPFYHTREPAFRDFWLCLKSRLFKPLRKAMWKWSIASGWILSLASDVRRPSANTLKEGILQPTGRCARHPYYHRQNFHISNLWRLPSRPRTLAWRQNRCMENHNRQSPYQKLLHILPAIRDGPCCGFRSGPKGGFRHPST